MEVHISVKAESLWSFDLGPLGTLNITNSFLQMVIVMALIIIIGAMIARKATLVPSRAQSLFEMVTEFLLSVVEGAAGRQVGRRIFPLIGSLFIFIILANYSGLIPGVGTIQCKSLCGWEESSETTAIVASAGHPGSDVVVSSATDEAEHEPAPPLLRAPNADLNMTLAMALIAFVSVQVAGIAAHGVGGRIKHMADPPFMFPIEVMSELSRIISLSFRLFGNIFAGEVLIGIMIAMSTAILEKTKWLTVIMFGLPTVFLLFEVLFGFIQALIFSLLTLAYIALATGGGDEHGHAHEPGEEPYHASAPATSGGD
ncbi:MAG: F0F1 ATP synthase subunit A [Thermomicrobiales bacterium]|nr:F0F1 ATP synthase subunit A [Thermomicrobiales bacterium]